MVEEYIDEELSEGHDCSNTRKNGASDLSNYRLIILMSSIYEKKFCSNVKQDSAGPR